MRPNNIKHSQKAAHSGMASFCRVNEKKISITRWPSYTARSSSGVVPLRTLIEGKTGPRPANDAASAPR